jgi:hypothetical protein
MKKMLMTLKYILNTIKNRANFFFFSKKNYSPFELYLKKYRYTPIPIEGKEVVKYIKELNEIENND